MAAVCVSALFCHLSGKVQMMPDFSDPLLYRGGSSGPTLEPPSANETHQLPKFSAASLFRQRHLVLPSIRNG